MTRGRKEGRTPNRKGERNSIKGKKGTIGRRDSRELVFILSTGGEKGCYIKPETQSERKSH